MSWNYDDKACDVLRLFTKLKCRFMPYLYSQAVMNVKIGVPFLRLMFFDFGEDPNVWTLDRQYMFGDYLMVAPVFNESGEVEFYLTTGKWTRGFDSDKGKAGEIVEGPRWFSETYSMMAIPLFLRECAVLVLGEENEGRVEYEYFSDVEIRLYNVTSEVERLVVDVDGNEAGLIKVKDTKVEVPPTRRDGRRLITLVRFLRRRNRLYRGLVFDNRLQVLRC